jgi:hypothetical protein
MGRMDGEAQKIDHMKAKDKKSGNLWLAWHSQTRWHHFLAAAATVCRWNCFSNPSKPNWLSIYPFELVAKCYRAAPQCNSECHSVLCVLTLRITLGNRTLLEAKLHPMILADSWLCLFCIHYCRHHCWRYRLWCAKYQVWSLSYLFCI